MTRARDKANLTQVATTTEPSPLTAGMVWLDTDATTTNVFEQRWRKSYSSAVTTISGADDYYLTLAYTVGFEKVFLNGVLLTREVDYTATHGTSIVLGSATNVGDYVEIITTSAFTAANTYTQAQTNAAFYPVTVTQIAGKNKLINADFSVNQRNFSSTTSNTIYTFDRWITNWSGGSATYSAQTFTLGTAPVAGYEGINFIRITAASQGTNTYAAINQRIEDVRTLAGQTFTVSFWAKASSGTPKVSAYIGQTFGSGGSAPVYTYGSAPTITTSWARYSITITAPSISGKTIGTSSYLDLGVEASDFYNSNLGAQNATIDLWGVQVEAGSVATQFTTASGTIQGELALCQRYYQRWNATVAYGNFFQGQIQVNNLGQCAVNLKVPMRVGPTAIDYSGSIELRTADNLSLVPTSLTIGEVNTMTAVVNLMNSNSNWTANKVGNLRANNDSTAYIGLTAEL